MSRGLILRHFSTMHMQENNKQDFVIQFSNDERLKNNKIFDSKIDPNLSIYEKWKNLLSSRRINLNTPDLRQSEKVKMAIYMNIPYPWNLADWMRILSCKNNVLFVVEPQMINPFNYSRLLQFFFKEVYTWDTDLACKGKYVHYSIAQSDYGLNTEVKRFKDKKLLTFVGGNKVLPLLFHLLVKFRLFRGRELYGERLKALDYFEKNIPDDFAFYGKGWDKPKKFIIKERILGFRKYKTYKGMVDNKIETISNYKFCLCFENATGMKGYITEKIFDCLKAKCIPIYWGATDIEKYIPKDCFIDFRDFDGYDDLVLFLKSMKEEDYNRRINNIERLLLNQEFMSTWFEDGWVENFSKKLGILHNDSIY